MAKLNDPPFRKSLSLVDFDDKSSFELLQLLNDVFASMDDTQGCDVRSVDRDMLLQRTMTFLAILKFPLPEAEGEREAFGQGLLGGEKHVVYPVAGLFGRTCPLLPGGPGPAPFPGPSPRP